MAKVNKKDPDRCYYCGAQGKIEDVIVRSKAWLFIAFRCQGIEHHEFTCAAFVWWPEDRVFWCFEKPP